MRVREGFGEWRKTIAVIARGATRAEIALQAAMPGIARSVTDAGDVGIARNVTNVLSVEIARNVPSVGIERGVEAAARAAKVETSGGCRLAARGGLPEGTPTGGGMSEAAVLVRVVASPGALESVPRSGAVPRRQAAREARRRAARPRAGADRSDTSPGAMLGRRDSAPSRVVPAIRGIGAGTPRSGAPIVKDESADEPLPQSAGSRAGRNAAVDAPTPGRPGGRRGRMRRVRRVRAMWNAPRPEDEPVTTIRSCRSG